MGPRAMARGTSAISCLPEGTILASMGPRAMARGTGHENLGVGNLGVASMGPRAMARGTGVGAVVALPFAQLQWGREQWLAGLDRRGCDQQRGQRASMGPRAMARGTRGGRVLPSLRCRCFNGAASNGSRDCQRVKDL